MTRSGTLRTAEISARQYAKRGDFAAISLLARIASLGLWLTIKGLLELRALGEERSEGAADLSDSLCGREGTESKVSEGDR